MVSASLTKTFPFPSTLLPLRSVPDRPFNLIIINANDGISLKLHPLYDFVQLTEDVAFAFNLHIDERDGSDKVSCFSRLISVFTCHLSLILPALIKKEQHIYSLRMAITNLVCCFTKYTCFVKPRYIIQFIVIFHVRII